MLVLTAILLTALLGAVALIIDLGQLRVSARVDQSVADLAALAAGRGLAEGNPAGACQAAVNYVNANARLAPPINATSFCAQGGNNVAQTTCSGGVLGQARPSATVGRYTIDLHYPVPASEIADPNVAGVRTSTTALPVNACASSSLRRISESSGACSAPGRSVPPAPRPSDPTTSRPR